MKKIRCAIYTRKSAEEGLEQDFNSLDAQREACAAYVASQKAEGWVLLPTVYEDAGISGGTLERPGLQRLLDDIDAGLVDQIVVYKVDRLTRSLSDFAKLVERLEKTLPEAFSRVVLAPHRLVPRVWRFHPFLSHRRCGPSLAHASALSDAFGAALVFLREAPLRVMRCALWRMRSQMASAWFGSPIASCHCLSGIWVAMSVEPRSARCAFYLFIPTPRT